MTQSADFIVIGGGIAGVSVACELSARGTVVLLEMESATGYHASGRSAAISTENYGAPMWRAISSASRAFLRQPPEGFSPVPLVSPRGGLFLACDGEQESLRSQAEEMTRRGSTVEVMPPEDALRLCPVVKASEFALAMHDPDTLDIDTHALMTGYARALRSHGGQVITSARVEKLDRSDGRWSATTAKGVFEAPIVVNAAGAWAREMASLAGLGNRNVVPHRRTAVTFDPPAGVDVHRWPMTFDLAETFYFKPEGGRVMASPADAEPSEPCDAQADELEVAIAVDRIQTYTTMVVRTLKHRWGGLRTFAPDHEPVIGPDPDEASFVWVAGQGGNGVMASPAAARLAASLATGDGVPVDLAALGVTGEKVSPGRACVSG